MNLLLKRTAMTEETEGKQQKESEVLMSSEISQRPNTNTHRHTPTHTVGVSVNDAKISSSPSPL